MKSNLRSIKEVRGDGLVVNKLDSIVGGRGFEFHRYLGKEIIKIYMKR